MIAFKKVSFNQYFRDLKQCDETILEDQAKAYYESIVYLLGQHKPQQVMIFLCQCQLRWHQILLFWCRRVFVWRWSVIWFAF